MKLLYAVAKALRCEPPCCGRPASDSVRKPDAGKLHVRFDERDLETERFALPRQISTLLKNAPGAPNAFGVCQSGSSGLAPLRASERRAAGANPFGAGSGPPVLRSVAVCSLFSRRQRYLRNRERVCGTVARLNTLRPIRTRHDSCRLPLLYKGLDPPV